MIRRILAVAMAYVCDNRSFWRSGIIYGPYRQGLVDERQQILDYLGNDFLSLEELRTAFPERYRQRMALPAEPDTTTKALDSTTTFCQSFGQIQGLYAENYPK